MRSGPYVWPGPWGRMRSGPYNQPMAVPTVAPPLAQLPNALTIARFALIPVFVVLVLGAEEGHSSPAAIVFGIAGITDQVDGYLARRWHVESEFGKYADPLADRLMIDAAIVLLWLEDRLPLAALAIILVRDVVLVGGSRFATQARLRRSRSACSARPRPGSSTPRSSACSRRPRARTGRSWIFWIGHRHWPSSPARATSVRVLRTAR